MDINGIDEDDGSLTYTVKLTKEDALAYPNAIAVLDRATTCSEILFGMVIMALEMEQKQGAFKVALREATIEKLADASPRGHYVGLERRKFMARRINARRRTPCKPDDVRPTPTNPLGQDFRKINRRQSHRRADDAL